MISLRQHAISIAAIFLALALGVVLGSQTIASDLLSGLRDDKTNLQGNVDQLQNENNQMKGQLGAADGFDAANAGRIVKDALAQRTVVLFTTPDADPGDVDAVSRIIGMAGGSVTGKVSLTDAFLDSTNGDRLRTTINNVIPAGTQLRTGAVDQGSLAGDLLGAVLQLNAKSAEPQSSPEEMALALDTLRSGGFIGYDDNSVKPAQLAVVLTGDSSSAETGNRGSVIARFAGAMDARGAGTVLAGRPGSANGNGPIAVMRADAALSASTSSIDDIDREAGRITTALALQEQLNGTAGRYGTGPKASAVTVGATPS
ncbi:copper transporter [Antrihabitans cavernicola]|uniref:Copper transporter n=1 Tax=Antrihabitans cavernicola TaxID=2495913 RepID=A0A5A7S0N7_9NOCA|nr:copper transporter [Spelaeibacter cavernicola]KAA0016183.1 copper transporter [Spelaeibacter cavernicola]